MRTIKECPACGADDADVIASLDEERMRRFAEFDRRKYGGLLAEWIDSVPPVVSRCPACGHCWYRHQPSTTRLDEMYAAGRPLLSDAPLSREPTERMLREMRRLRRLTSKSRPALLDYGSGHGRWARAGARAGFAVHAYEPSVARGAEEVDEFAVVHELAALDGMQFDVVNLEQVLEHIPDPLGALYLIRDFCSAQTIVRVTVPNILRTPEGKALWDEWPFNGHRPHTMAPFEHLHGFTPKSLFKLLGRAGFVGSSRALIFGYPLLMVRDLAGRLWPALGQTMTLSRRAENEFQYGRMKT